MIVKITKKHISAGIPLACTSDPLAIALRELNYKNVTIGLDTVNCADSDFKELDFIIEDSGVEWLRRFDLGEKVKPTEIELLEA